MLKIAYFREVTGKKRTLVTVRFLLHVLRTENNERSEDWLSCYNKMFDDAYIFFVHQSLMETSQKCKTVPKPRTCSSNATDLSEILKKRRHGNFKFPPSDRSEKNGADRSGRVTMHVCDTHTVLYICALISCLKHEH